MSFAALSALIYMYDSPILVCSACDRDLETTLPISKIETLPEKEAHRPRSITEVVAAKRDNARRRVQHRQQAIERSKTAREANPDVAKKASAATKRKLKKERSLSLPVISIEGNCAVSFLFSDGESSDSDGGGDGKVANPYFNMCKLSPSPTPTGRKGHSSPEDGSGNAQSGDLNPKDGVEMASSVQAGVVQVLELTMSDPENDYDSAEADNIFLDALADSAARKKLKHKVAMYVDVDPKEDAQSAASTRRSVSLQHVTQNEGWEAGTAPGTPPQSDGTWKRGARFKRSRRGSKKQRVRVVSRAVTFHSHAQSPQLVPAISFQTTSLQSISKKYPSSGVVVQKERRGSVVEVSPADMEHEDETTSVTDMQTSPDSEAAVNSDHVQLSIARKANGSHGTARNHVQVPANSPVSENDLCNGAESHSSAAIAKHILKAKGLPMVTGQQRRKKREELRKKLVAITPRRRNSLSSPTSMTPTVPEESIAVAWTNGSTPMDSAIPRLSALDYVANNDTDGSLSPESVLSSDLPMDVYGTKPQGVPYCPLVDLESPLKSSERESPV